VQTDNLNPVKKNAQLNNVTSELLLQARIEGENETFGNLLAINQEIKSSVVEVGQKFYTSFRKMSKSSLNTNIKPTTLRNAIRNAVARDD
jgi:hypothetical protein